MDDYVVRSRRLLPLVLLLAACGSLPHDPDPGDRRLEDLKNEPAGALVMPGFRIVKEEIRAKQLGEAGNAKDLGTGPSIEKNYQSDEPVELGAAIEWHETRLADLNWRFASQPKDFDAGNKVERRYRKKIRNWCAGLTFQVTRTLPAPVFLRLEMSSGASASPEEDEPCPGTSIRR